MKISDMDIETKKLMLSARMVARFPTTDNMERLIRHVADWDEKHQDERARNLINALWGKDGIMREPEGK